MIEKMVGETGFEPATSCSQSKQASRKNSTLAVNRAKNRPFRVNTLGGRCKPKSATVDRPKEGVVYFIGADKGPIKIGFTADLEGRLARLQSNSPVKLRVLVAVRGDLGDEHDTHRVFSEFRVHGEWFQRSPELMRHIDWFVRHGLGLPEPADDTIPAEIFAELSHGVA